jgi:hypothetical protein
MTEVFPHLAALEREFLESDAANPDEYAAQVIERLDREELREIVKELLQRELEGRPPNS